MFIVCEFLVFGYVVIYLIPFSGVMFQLQWLIDGICALVLMVI